MTLAFYSLGDQLIMAILWVLCIIGWIVIAAIVLTMAVFTAGLLAQIAAEFIERIRSR